MRSRPAAVPVRLHIQIPTGPVLRVLSTRAPVLRDRQAVPSLRVLSTRAPVLRDRPELPVLRVLSTRVPVLRDRQARPGPREIVPLLRRHRMTIRTSMNQRVSDSAIPTMFPRSRPHVFPRRPTSPTTVCPTADPPRGPQAATDRHPTGRTERTIVPGRPRNPVLPGSPCLTPTNLHLSSMT